MRVRALAKINLSLHVLGATADGFHELRTVFQSIALHDTLTFRPASGPFRIVCSDPSCPVDETNLVWRAAALVWRAANRRGAPRDLIVRLTKRVPMQAGLGGGSSDAAATLRACAALWDAKLTTRRLAQLASTLGADVPYFLQGGTALGTGKGDVLLPLDDAEASWATLVLPAFGVSTKDAYSWWDADGRGAGAQSDVRNDLQAPVAARHPEIGQILTRLAKVGALEAMMSGSGSAVYGLFRNRPAAEHAAEALFSRSTRTLVTRTVNRMRYQALAAL
ncbi:MAG TPA: 4-(cytidine 5'-diphospho)-2-C-methyl-D-erythritol kinase [Vicinamibacterales bacterium]|jgi:4-diphosphocytidyl-2-C-methyl-D-erythritol kinase